MSDPIHLEVDDVIEMHSELIEAFGGPHGIRDRGLLESAVRSPLASFGEKRLYETVTAQAAALAFHLVKNHAFIDGNKRIGDAAAATYLAANGLTLPASIDVPDADDMTPFERIILQVAEGRLDIEGLTRFFDQTLELSAAL